MVGNFTKEKILLVGSDEMYLNIINYFLQQDFDLYKTKSENDAVEYLSKVKFTTDLIIVDIDRPNVDGIDFFNTIKGIALLQDIPIILLTQTEGIEEYKNNFSPYLKKPFNEIQLKEKIKILMENQCNKNKTKRI